MCGPKEQMIKKNYRVDLLHKRLGPSQYDPEKKRSWIFVLCFLSSIFFIISRFIPLTGGAVRDRIMIRASEIMAGATSYLSDCFRDKQGHFVSDTRDDINQTGLIGLEFSPITTSLGNLEAKRTTTNPNFAGLIVFLLKKAGVRSGDTIAIGASSSFPALIVATLSAAKAMDLKVLMICSLGASQWGANNPGFHWLDMQDCLSASGIFLVKPLAFSLGGDEDAGKDMERSGRSLLAEELKKRQVVVIRESGLRANVLFRMRIYEQAAGKDRIKAFLNIGGSWANLGTDSGVLKLRPGLTSLSSFPPPERRGVIHEMAGRRIPVIHLLYIRGLIQQYGLPWDPSPLPRPGQGDIIDPAGTPAASFLILAGMYFLLILTASAWIFRRKAQEIS
jgi:poly-gamma-glutamate system protein